MKAFALGLLLALCAIGGQATTYTISIGALNTVSFTPSALTIAPGDTVLFNFTEAGDAVVSSANEVTPCPDGVDLVVANCALAANPFVNITGPSSGQALFTVPLTFPTAGVFPIVNPTFCNAGTTQLACGAKAIITVAQPVSTPAPGATIIIVGVNQTASAFPTPLVVTTGDSVWFQFAVLAGVMQVDINGVVVPNGLSCPVATSVGQFCEWPLTQAQTYYFTATPFTFGGSIIAQMDAPIPSGAFVIDVGQNGNSFSVPAGNVPVGSVIYFRFDSYGPYRVQRANGPTCDVYLGTGAFDSFYQESGRVFPVMVTTQGITYFMDPDFCASGMRGSLLAVGNSGGGSFVNVQVAPLSNVTGVSELVYAPNPVVVYQGGSVRWTWTTFGHTVTQSLDNSPTTCLPQPGGFDSGFIQPPVNGLGGTFTQQFNVLGTFYYFCRAHCDVGMRGAVIVVPNPQNVIQHGVSTDPTDPNRFAPPLITVYVNQTVCWDFQTAGDVVQSQYYQDCVPLAGGFNSGPQSVGATVCLNLTGPACTAFYYYDSAQCASNAMYGVVLLSDVPTVTVNAAADVFVPAALSVTLGQTVTWDFVAAGNSVTQIASLAQVTSANEAVRCAVVSGGINSGVVDTAPFEFNHTFDTVGTYAFITTPFCPFPATVPGFYSSVEVCDPIETRPTTTTASTTSTATPTPTPNPCPPEPCTAYNKKTVINFFFADILAGANVGCPTCGADPVKRRRK